jgi:uncharacterized membrane protein (UPF0127 family)
MAKQQKKINWKAIVAVLLIVAFLGSYLASLFGHRNLHVGGTESVTSTTSTVASTEPPFVKNGELSFLAAADRRPIKRIAIEIADNDARREQGLMYRKSMADTNGMLFLFPTSEPQNFWMHNTYIPLDIIYVDENRTIVTIARNCKPLNDDNIPSYKNAQYVVEVNGGFCDKYGIKEGDVVSF